MKKNEMQNNLLNKGEKICNKNENIFVFIYVPFVAVEIAFQNRHSEVLTAKSEATINQLNCFDYLQIR